MTGRDSRWNRLELAVDSGIAGLVRLGWVQADGVLTAPPSPALIAESEALVERYRERFVGRSPSEIAPLGPARELYRAFGIDPTRTRPSSEALLRRALKGKGLPRISNAVDLCNLCSLRFLLPIGLYDVSKIRPPVELRCGLKDEAYRGIRKDEVRLDGRPTLVDAEGPFGNPTSDSLRTSVDDSTVALWMVIFSPSSYPVDQMEDNVARAREGMGRHLAPAGAEVATRGVVWAPRP